MTLTRKIALLCLGIAVLIAGIVIYRSSSRIAQFEAASAALGQTARRVLTANQDMDGAVEKLTQYLLDVQTHKGAPASYDEWSQQQRQAHTAMSQLGHSLAELGALAAEPDTADPSLATALKPFPSLLSTLAQHWFAYDEQGSGLTPHSRAYAISTLLPLVTTELKPAVTALRDLHQNQWSDKIALISAHEAEARHTRLAAGVALLLIVGIAVIVVIITPGRFRPHRPAIPLPLQPEQPASPAGPPPRDYAALDAKMPAGAAKILVVEANPDLREMLGMLVATGGYGVVTCGTAAEAISAIKAIGFDIIVLDRQLPGRRDFEVAVEARLIEPKIKVILISETPSEPAAGQLSEHRIMEVFAKRPDPQVLLSSISAALTCTPIPFASFRKVQDEREPKRVEEAVAEESILLAALEQLERGAPKEPEKPAEPPPPRPPPSDHPQRPRLKRRVEEPTKESPPG